jgi:hypothetical protein
VRRLEQRSHPAIEPGKPGRGHSHHYRLIEKGAQANLLKGEPANLSQKPKGEQANLFDEEKGAPANL